MIIEKGKLKWVAFWMLSLEFEFYFLGNREIIWMFLRRISSVNVIRVLKDKVDGSVKGEKEMEEFKSSEIKFVNVLVV